MQDTSWHEIAVAYYLDNHTMQETLLFMRQTFKVSDRALRKLLKDRGINRGVSGAQKLKRFNCKCKICMIAFKGRTPTAVMCDECVGDDAVGATPQRLKRYQHFKRMQSYGINIKTYDDLLVKQNNCCGLCQCDLRKLSSHLIHLDHCHVTGYVRGILCQNCNHALGVIEKRGGQCWLNRAENWIKRIS